MHIEEEQRDRVLRPAHLFTRIHAAKAVQQPLEAAARARRPIGPPFHDVGDVGTERLGAQDDDAENEGSQKLKFD